LKELTGYVKDMAWSYEKEIRIQAEFNNKEDLSRVSIDLPNEVIDTMIITASPLFEGDLYTELQKEIKRHISIDNSLFKERLIVKTVCQTCELKQAN
jgi:hypothetical protein